ncbi:T9SS type A sorting domain-containing protein [Brumimicrobium mesophilum]|uniref:T9SS type A sorting domain-containing protein n=1 Tax=Brumimicrobium mesophilum TaxID=392717 RepID=UPI000D1436C4|nr:T9SS type A sorting domain-containing protein [Brumimicrobium mesophilum]
MEILRKIIFICVFSFPLIGIAQSTFYKKFTSGPFDQGFGIVQLPDSSYAITGTSGGFNNDSGQAFLMIIDSLGNQKWTKNYGDFGEDIGMRVIHVPNDGFYIAGYTGSTANGDFDFVLYKTDLSGNLQWEETYGGADWDVLHDAALLDDGGLILVGETDGLLSQGKDVFMVRTDALGAEIWTKTIQTAEDDFASSVLVLSPTEFVIGGNIGDFGISKGMLASYHVDGTENWVEILDQAGVTKVNDMALDQGIIYMAGYIKHPTENKNDFWYAKSDLNGNYVGQNFFQGYLSGGYYNSIAVSGNGVYLGMLSDSPEINPYPGGLDAFVQLYSFSNIYEAGATFSAFDEDMINQLILTNDGGVAFVGTASDNPLNSSLGSNVMVAKLGANAESTPVADNGLDLVSLSTEEKKIISLYPNPTSSFINISSELDQKPFELRNIQGKLVKSGNISTKLSLSELKKGVYFLRIEDSNQLWSAKIIKN